FFPDSSKMCAFQFGDAARQNRKETEVVSGEFDYFHPAFWFPKLFHSRRAWMENGERLMMYSIHDDGGGALLRRGRKLKHRLTRARGNSERPQKGEIVIPGVHLFHRAIDEVVVTTCAEFRFGFQSIGNNSPPGPRQKC